MSFTGTVQYKKPTEGAKFVVPMRAGRHSVPEYYLTPELKKEFARLFPIKTNHEIMILFGLSAATMHRFARTLGLTKNMRIIRNHELPEFHELDKRSNYDKKYNTEYGY